MNMENEFLSAALDYAKRGWKVIPLGDAKSEQAKVPRLKDWPNLASCNPAVIMQWWSLYPDANVGIVTGSTSGIFVLDVDPKYGGDESLKALEDQYGSLPKTVQAITGSGGSHIYFNYPNGMLIKNSCGKLRAGLDIRSDGGQVVAEPSIHSNGRPYAFDLEHHPDEVPVADMPGWLLELLTKEATVPYEAGVERLATETTVYGRIALISESEAVMNALPGEQEVTLNNASLKIGSLVKNGQIAYDEAYDTLVDAGLAMANEPDRAPWTYQEIGYKVRRALRDATPRQLSEPDLDFIDDVLIDEVMDEPESSSASSIPDCILNPPGTLGKLARWIYDTALYPDAFTAVAASIPLLGVIKAHKAQSPSGLRTNFYTIGIAPSGAGKEHARRKIQVALKQTGMLELLGGDAASTAGLLKSLYDAGGRRLMLVDEYGLVLKTFTGKKVATHLLGMAPLMMKLFTSAQDTFLGNEYANGDGKRPRQDIEQPCLNIYGTTTPQEYYNALSSREALNGFLPRHLVFVCHEPALTKQKDRKLPVLPPEVEEELLKWKNVPTNADPQGNLDSLNIKPREVPLNPDAKAILDAYADEMRAKGMRKANQGTGRDAIYNRSAEHAEKLALVATDYDEPEISVATVQWAIEMVNYCNQELCQGIETHVSDNATEANVKRVLQIISDYKGWMSATILCKRTYSLGRRERQEIIETLLESEQIERKYEGGVTNKKIVYRAK